jgi:hypothetical protein
MSDAALKGEGVTEILRVLKSTRKGVNQLHNKYIESASKTRRLGIIKRRLGSIKRNYRTTRVENK